MWVCEKVSLHLWKNYNYAYSLLTYIFVYDTISEIITQLMRGNIK